MLDIIIDVGLCILIAATFYSTALTHRKINRDRRDALPQISVKYHTEIDPVEIIDKGNWIDLRAAETYELKAGESKILSLGISMKLPDGFEAYVVPRSSTFKRYGIIQTNGIGIIDGSYCGDGDVWGMPVYATRDTVIYKNDRVCQFRIMRSQDVSVETVEHLEGENRGGFGSTGR